MADIKKPGKNPKLPEIILNLYVFLWICTLIYGIYRITFGATITNNEYLFAGSVILTWLAIGIFAVVIKELALFFHEKTLMGRFSQYRTFMLIGLTGCTFFGLLPRIVVFFADEWVMSYTIYVTLGGMSFFAFFYLPFVDMLCTVKRSWRDGNAWMIFLVHTGLIVFVWNVSVKYYSNKPNELFVILGTQVLFASVCAMTTIDFYYIWNRSFKLNEEHDDEMAEDLFIVKPMKTATGLRFQCNICWKQFNQGSRTPRILKECGHTVCQECTEILMDKMKGHAVFCPFCETATLVKGPATSLPKNFTILECFDAEEVQKKKTIEEV